MCNGEVWSFVMVKKQQRTEPLKQDYKYSRYQQIWSVKVMYTYVYIATATMSVCLSVCLSVTLSDCQTEQNIHFRHVVSSF